MQTSMRDYVVKHFPAWSHPILRRLEKLSLTMTSGVVRRLPLKETSTTPPRRATPTLQHYAEARPDAASYREIYPPHLSLRSPPYCGEAGLHHAFAEEMSRAMPSAGVGLLRNGRVMTGMGAIITPDNRLVYDVSHTAAGGGEFDHPIFTQLSLPEITNVDERIAVITMYPGNLPKHPLYAHWLLDILPRLCLLEKSGISWTKLVVPQVTSYQRESLELLGIGKEKIISSPALHLRAAELIVPTLVGFPIGNYPAWACRWLRERFLPLAPPAEPSQPRRLYISRSKAARRRLLNEDQLMKELEPMGFQLIHLEDRSFIDNIRLMRDAELVVSPHGANTAIFVFCREGTPVIELFSPRYVAACHFSAACQVNLRYGYVVGEGRPGSFLRPSDDIRIDPEKVVRLIETMKLPDFQEKECALAQ